MSFDIYGQRLRAGYCEVHPRVHEEYPCSVCMADSARRRQQPRAVRWLESTSVPELPSAAARNLRSRQRQLDMDGCEVGVSRQALEEVLTEYAGLLESLTEVCDWISGCLAADDDSMPAPEMLRETERLAAKARAAIAKATGGA